MSGRRKTYMLIRTARRKYCVKKQRVCRNTK